MTLLYIYAGYPLLVWVLSRLWGRPPLCEPILPSVSLVISAYNEAAYIEQKLHNSLALDYPSNRLEIIVASDGSTDQTNAIVKRFKDSRIRLVALTRNVGKAAMLNRVIPLLRGEIIVFSDASSELSCDALRQLVRNFADRQVGCVSGLYRLRAAQDMRSEGEGLYWKYETFIKEQESRLHSIMGAHGACYAIRKQLFQQLGDATINDDYLIPMHIVAQGYRAVYEPSALCWEREVASMEGEFARRRRIAAGNCQQMVELRNLLHPRHGWVAFCFFSHKVLRTLAPILMVGLFGTTFSLPQPWLGIFLGLQGVFYASGWIGYYCQQHGYGLRWLSAPMYFCVGNLAMLGGLLKYCLRRKQLVWERAR